MQPPPPPGWLPPGFAPPGYAPPGYTFPAQLPPPYFAPPPPPPLRPGCVPLRPLAVGDILDGAFRVVRRNPRATLGPAVIVAVVQAVLVASFQFLVYGANRTQSVADPNDPAVSGGQLTGQLSAAFSLLVIGTLLGAILTGLLTAVITEDVLGVKLSIADAWQRTRPRIWALVGLSIVTTLLELLGLLPCLVLGVWLWGIWAVSMPALMVEGLSVRGALGRSRQLVAGTVLAGVGYPGPRRAAGPGGRFHHRRAVPDRRRASSTG